LNFIQVKRDVILAVVTEPMFTLETPPPSWFSLSQGPLTTIRHFENRRGEGPGDEVDHGLAKDKSEF